MRWGLLRRSLIIGLVVLMASGMILTACKPEVTPVPAVTPTPAATPAPVVTPTPGEPIKIGWIIALGGVASALGPDAVRGAQMAVEEINAAGGVLGRPLRLIVRDSKLKPDIALREAKDLLLTEKVFILAGCISSGIAITISEFAKENKIPFVIHNAESARITGSKGHRYVFRTHPNTWARARVAALATRDMGWKKVFVTAQDYEFGHSVSEAYIKNVKEVVPDIEIAGLLYTKFGETDYTPFIPKIIASGADAVISFHWGSDMVNLIKQAIPFGVFERMRFYSTEAGDLYAAEALGEAFPDGVVGSAPYLFYYPDTPKHRAWVKKFRDRWGLWPATKAMPGYWAVYAIAQAIEKVGVVDREKFIDALEGMEIRIDVLDWKFKVRECDHQAMAPYLFGTIYKDPRYPFKILRDIKYYKGEDIHRTCEQIAEARRTGKD